VARVVHSRRRASLHRARASGASALASPGGPACIAHVLPARALWRVPEGQLASRTCFGASALASPRGPACIVHVLRRERSGGSPRASLHRARAAGASALASPRGPACIAHVPPARALWRVPEGRLTSRACLRRERSDESPGPAWVGMVSAPPASPWEVGQNET
jgi:hypothetical protein